MTKRQIFILLFPSILMMLIFFIVPLGIVFNNSLLSQNGDLTIQNYLRFLGDPYLLQVLLRTFKIGVIVTVISLIVGYIIAYYMTKVMTNKLAKHIAYILVISPLFTSAVVRSFGWMVILGNNGFLNNMLMKLNLIEKPIQLLYNEIGIIIGLVHILVPFMILSLTGVLQNIDKRLDEASWDLGFNKWQTFIKVTFPLSFPGILAGSIMVFSLALSAYVTPAMLSGGRVQLLATLIYEQMMSVFDYPFGSAVSFILLVFALLILVLNNYLLKSKWAEAGGR